MEQTDTAEVMLELQFKYLRRKQLQEMVLEQKTKEDSNGVHGTYFDTFSRWNRISTAEALYPGQIGLE